MESGKWLALVAMLLFAAGGVVASQTSGTSQTKAKESATTSKTATTVHHEMGTVSSVTSNELVLDHTWKGKAEKTKFTLDSDTKEEGNVAQDDHVTVYYHMEKGERVATELKAMAAKPATETKKS